ncbi:MAG: hypothetical protein HOW97_22750 [Catenulispora sp.]|nr:hypothetical protein [Catenulispora sp.]
MSGAVGRPAQGRRFVITMGTGRYRDLPPGEQLRWVTRDVDRVGELFTGFGYHHSLRGLAEYATAEHVRNTLSQWTADVGLGEHDAVVFYFAGHGLVEERDRHYLMCWSSSEHQPAATALAAEDLVRILTGTGLRNLLVILDTCYGGAGTADQAAVALRTVARRISSDRAATGMWFLSSARAKDEATDGAFVDALEPAIAEASLRTGQRQRYVDLSELVERINTTFQDRDLGQRAEMVAGLVTGLAPFIPNAEFREYLPPPGTDLEVQTRIADQDLTEHFGPRARGVEFESEQGVYFSGREQALAELAAWMTAESGDGRGRVVTGSPGCGKSAVLGRIVALSDPGYRTMVLTAGPRPGAGSDADSDADSGSRSGSESDPGSGPGGGPGLESGHGLGGGSGPGGGIPPNIVDAAIHARHKRLEEVVARFAADLRIEAASAAELLHELSRRDRTLPPLVLVIDALDEAGSGTAADTGGRGEPRRIARDLLRPMSEIPGVRLLVGARRELIPSLGATFTKVDLDTPRYRADQDVAGYVAKVLLAADEPDVKTPYRDRPELAQAVGAGVARRASGVFLVARMAARSLRSATEVIDPDTPGWIDRLPSEIGEAFEDYLQRFGTDEQRVRRMLTPLAFAEGQGLPRGEIWARLATALSGVETSEEDIAWVLKAGGSYIAEVTDQARSVYRLYHQSLAEHLRRDPTIDARRTQSQIVDALVALVPVRGQGGRDWFGAHRYTLSNLATHAAAACRLDELVVEPGFLLASEQLAVIGALPAVQSAEARTARNAYEQVAHRLDGQSPLGDRASYLQLSARRCGADRLADRINGLGVPLRWSVPWAWWSPTGVHRQLRGHSWGVSAVAVGEVDGRAVALTGSYDGTARMWDLSTQRQLGPALGGYEEVSAVALGDIDEYSVALVAGDDGTVRVFDLSSGSELGEPLRGHTNLVRAIAIGTLAGRPIAVTASADGTARVWDMDTRRQLGVPFSEHRSTVHCVALGTVDGRPIAVTGGGDNRARIWDLMTREPVGAALIGHADTVSAVAVCSLDGKDTVVTGCHDGTVGFWDLATRQQIGEPLAAHFAFVRLYRRVSTVALGVLDAEPVLLTCSHKDVRVWNVRTRQRIGQPLTGHAGLISAAALGMSQGRTIAVTGGSDRTARIWDLAADNPATGHTGDITAVSSRVVHGRHLAITGGSDTTARIWDLDGHRQIGQTLDEHSGTVGAVVLGPLGSRTIAVTGSTDTTIYVWDCATQQPLIGPLTGHTNSVTALALAEHAGRCLVISGSADGTVRFWDPENGTQPISPLTRHRGGVSGLAVCAAEGGTALLVATTSGDAYAWLLSDAEVPPRLSGSLKRSRSDTRGDSVGVGFVAGRPVAMFARDDNVVRMWDVITTQEVGPALIGHTGRIDSVTLGVVEGADVALTSSYDGTTRLWRLSDGTQLSSLILRGASGQHACLTGTGTGVVICEQQAMRVWNHKTSRPIGEPLSGLEAEIAAIGIADVNGTQVVATASIDATIRFHTAGSGAQATAPLIASKNVGGMTLIGSDDFAGCILGERSGAIKIWYAAASEPPAELRGHTGYVRALSTMRVAGQNLLVSGSFDTTLRIWDLDSRQSAAGPLSGHTAYVTAVATVDLDGQAIACSAALDGTIRMWELPSGRSLGEPLAQQISSFQSLATGRRNGRHVLVAGDEEGRIHMWDLLSRSPIELHISQRQDAVLALCTGELDGLPVAIAGDAAGLVSVMALDTGRVVGELGLEVVVNDLSLSPQGQLYVATDLGTIALDLRGLTGRTSS